MIAVKYLDCLTEAEILQTAKILLYTVELQSPPLTAKFNLTVLTENIKIVLFKSFSFISTM